MMYWLNVTLFYMDLFMILFMAAFPIAVLFVHVGCKHEMRHNILVITPGLLLGIHLGWIAYTVWSMLHPPPGGLLLDLHPLDEMIQFTMNWSIPFCIVGMILAFALGRRKIKKTFLLIGVIIFSITTVGFILYSRYFFGDLLGDPLKDYLWWLF